MIAIFTILGLLLFGGGAYAIYDGWPYLVLERGFTEVIMGSIASSAGLIMLSLAWILREVRATRRALVEAIELRSAMPSPAASAVEAPPVSLPRDDATAFARSVAPAAIGAVAGAAATSAVAQALTGPEDENASAPAEVPASSGDRDLFGAPVAHDLQEPEPAAESEPEAASESAQTQAEEAEPLPDMFEEALPTASPQPVAFEAEEHELAEPAAADAQPLADEEAFAVHDAPVPFGDRPSVEPPADEPAADPAEAGGAIAAAGDEAERDEFSALRESLAGHLNEPEPATGRVEPSFSQEPDPFAEAETWMDRASPRREPWLDTSPAAAEEVPTETGAPLWPPRTEPHAFDAPAEPAADDAETEAVSDAVDPPLQDDESDAGNVEPESASEPVKAAEPQAEAAPAATDSRPASDEGIVGAYQVGDAHFTIFADGSIRARTPDGEYSFASMDELKVYLASEKSRLGV
ncbi:hypothetical protein [Bosea robiniae]|uniref:Uncharacterized protein n=1 Tax=Bosea robiniae TaxID=1036780 RepID=A0ABY0NNE0_9HYPH|nr:hypothetical protein [Bosea robiniae]SDF49481.1 hypothetical protein SAMN05421844_101750 [Bosea robiniae]